MMHKGNRNIVDNLPHELGKGVNQLLDEFGSIVNRISMERRLQAAIVRSRLPCSLVLVVDKERVFVAAQHHLGMPSSMFLHHPDKEFTPQDIMSAARWEFGFEDPFLISFPASILNHDSIQRQEILEAVGLSHVESEFQRVIKMTSVIQINPLFGTASYTQNEKLVFILMPFTDELTRVYEHIIKPTVEHFGLLCKRADDYKTNRAIIQDIWQAICESRVVIADMTGLNPNVMYELGIAHTVGKETVLIYQKNKDDVKFPFDISHIRRIEYEDNAIGGKQLEKDLQSTLASILRPTSIS